MITTKIMRDCLDVIRTRIIETTTKKKNGITAQFFTGMTQLVSEREHCSAFRVRLHFSECRQRWQVTLKMTRPAHADGSQCCALGKQPHPPPALASPLPNSPIRTTGEACDGHARGRAAPI